MNVESTNCKIVSRMNTVWTLFATLYQIDARTNSLLRWSGTGELLNDLDKSNTSATFWAGHKWNAKRQKNSFRLHTFISSTDPSPPRMTQPRPLGQPKSPMDCSTQQCTNGDWCPRWTADAEQRGKWLITH